MKQIKKIIIALLSFTTVTHTQPTFKKAWQNMQRVYSKLESKFSDYVKHDKEKFHTSSWIKRMAGIRKTIKGPCNQHFLNTKDIRSTMIRGSYEDYQRIEECYLTYCTSPAMRKLIEIFKKKNREADWIPGQRSTLYNCSVNSLGHLYYAIRALEKNDEPNVIVEFGGGYGNLARIFKMFVPKSTIIIIDLPELLSIQHLFLSYMMPDTEIVVHEESTHTFKKGCIHLIPIYVIQESTINADLFISNFAITESPYSVQDLVIEKQFFDASTCYLTGQLNGWKDGGCAWIPDHEHLINNTKKLYRYTDCTPYHIFRPDLLNFELIAHIQKNKLCLGKKL